MCTTCVDPIPNGDFSDYVQPSENTLLHTQAKIFKVI